MEGGRPWRRRLFRATVALAGLGVIGAVWFLHDWRRLPEPDRSDHARWVDQDLSVLDD